MTTETSDQTLCSLSSWMWQNVHKKLIYCKLFDHPNFVSLCNVMDRIIKERHPMGLGVRKSTDIISLNHKDMLSTSRPLHGDIKHSKV